MQCHTNGYLLTTLRYYGINGSTYNWIQTWLTCRSQCVTLDASPVPVLYGVPQRTVLGPVTPQLVPRHNWSPRTICGKLCCRGWSPRTKYGCHGWSALPQVVPLQQAGKTVAAATNRPIYTDR